jgi:hypothetical protein
MEPDHQLPLGLAPAGEARFVIARSVWDRWIALFVGVFFLGYTYLWIYRGAFGEADSAAIAVGIHQAVLHGQGLAEPLLYLPVGHPLYYLILVHWPGAASLDRVISMMNHLSWLSMGGTFALAYLICRRFARPTWALAALVAVASSPLAFEVATYGHPVTPALFLFMVGTVALLSASERGFLVDARGVGLVALSALAVGASICTRADSVFFLPALVALAHAVRRERRSVVAACLAVVPAMMIYIVARKLVPAAGPHQGNAIHDLINFVAAFYKPRLLGTGVAWFWLVIGPGLGLAIVAAVVGLLRRRSWMTLFHGLCLMGPTFLFFVGNPHPSRHFLHVIIGAAFFLAMAGEQLQPVKQPRVATLVPLVIALNLGLFPLFGAVAHAAGWEPARVSEKGSWLSVRLTQSVFQQHVTNQRFRAWDRARWERIFSKRPEDDLMIGEWVDHTGLLMYSSGRDLRILRSDNVSANGVRYLNFMIDGVRFHFWEWYPGDPARPPVSHQREVILLYPYSPADLERLPRGSQDASEWRAVHTTL